jgi:hypothetical protein
MMNIEYFSCRLRRFILNKYAVLYALCSMLYALHLTYVTPRLLLAEKPFQFGA